MNILSKYAPLEESISKMKATLEDVGCETTFSHEKHPLEHCYSVNFLRVIIQKKHGFFLHKELLCILY